MFVRDVALAPSSLHHRVRVRHRTPASTRRGDPSGHSQDSSWSEAAFRAFESQHGARIRTSLAHLRCPPAERREAYDAALLDAFILTRRAQTGTAGDLEIVTDILRAVGTAMRRASRRASLEVPLLDDAGTSAEPRPGLAAYRAVLWQWEERLLGTLSAGERAALELHVMDGRSDREIADEHGLSVDSVRTLRRRALEKCRQRILTSRAPPPPDPPDG